jgi:hypothetical protein
MTTIGEAIDYARRLELDKRATSLGLKLTITPVEDRYIIGFTDRNLYAGTVVQCLAWLDGWEKRAIHDGY